ncbi:flagellar capping protein [Oleiphilus sp. HI0125]|uniref:flagellar filament capping protein FliD n=2 Tax=Oleiphilus sp. HI0125 TaxID=1822266 RepID=UPI0007C20B71|nr:flagellar filament capping protein FliD [Oleiphilus sp. HI0125]KZZ60695.1 flagellar capping protein [Oleiphilus sp. HI0125]
MANVSSVGIGSGVLTSDLIDQLVSAERTPTENRLDSREQSVTAELSLFAQIQSAVTDIRLPARNLANPDTFNELTVNAGSSAFTASSNSKAIAGNYTLEVTSLAKSQSLSSGTFADSDTTQVGEGTLAFTIDGVTTNLAINSSNNTLDGIASAINEESALGASATVINNGSGYQLVITSSETGVAKAIEINVTDSDGNNIDGTGLSQLSYTTGAQNLIQNQAATDASFNFNGIAITRTSNTVDDLVEGLTIELKGTNTGSPASLTVERDDDVVVEKVQEFVDKYNALRALIVENSQIDPSNPAAAGLLVGDTATRSISNQIRNILGRTIEGLGNDPVRGLAELGISTNNDTGNLQFNEAEFREKLESSPESVAAVFSKQGRTTDGQIEFLRAGSDTKPGSYDINVTQLSTKGAFTGASALAASTVIDGDNDTFTLSIDGNSSATITLTAGTYNQADLVAEIQSQINADQSLSNAGVSLVVALDGSNQLTFTSDSYGSNSQVQFLGVDATTLTTLGIDAVAGTAGLDVEGTINGVAATGTGQVLSGASGTDVAGLLVEIQGGATGSRGSVSYIEGVGEKLVDLINNFLSVDGTITAKNERLNSELDSIALSRANLEERLTNLESNLVRQFTAADILIAQLNSTQDFIKGQLEALAGTGSDD